MLIGISFLSGPSFYSSSLKVWSGRVLFVILVSLVFALFSFLLGWIIRRSLGFTSSGLKRIFLYQFITILSAFIIVTIIVTINS